jgi:hypothetical protein
MNSNSKKMFEWRVDATQEHTGVLRRERHTQREVFRIFNFRLARFPKPEHRNFNFSSVFLKVDLYFANL